MRAKWFLLTAAVLGITIALIVIGLDLTSGDPLAGVEAVAIEGVTLPQGGKIPELPGGQDAIEYGLSLALKERGIRIVERRGDAEVTIQIDVQRFDFDGGLHILATAGITKRNGEKHTMIFRLDATFTPEFKLDASIRKS
jgi:hypothetical protein